ncbi:MAG: hypothetical protein U5L98_15055 [Halomonas sp.]|uniref:DUF6932 family protein n=1 Tax=Halomonas sp. TaxID=1486246 RepID=UPI002ACD70AB|nr:hypothetical protein [Halomonas sp.]MDZ7853919.1 hypothetical protein [Halomonas sp.]
MINVPIPDWTAEGVLPPVDANSPTSPNRSPYQVALVELVDRFGTSNERIRMLDGFLRYRQGLHNAGLTQGFQWLDGSYLEQIEAVENRAPNDIDVVSFVEFPMESSQSELLDKLDDVIGIRPKAHATIKDKFNVDAFYVPMNLIPPERLVIRTSYWYSMWSHRRDDVWKGFLQVSLSPDPEARKKLERLKDQEGV